MRTASVDWDINMSEESALLVCGWQPISVLHSTEGHSATCLFSATVAVILMCSGAREYLVAQHLPSSAG